ncbi:MAG TPA: glycosyltransferase family 39 protein [Candidatus Eisenbacteria bacterium]|nr:glycosyltransferase family 39 protein [Candidatus Eisenbacteria bacterium]
MSRKSRRPPPPARAPRARPGVTIAETPLAWALAALLGIALLVVAFGPHKIGDYSTETDFYGSYAYGARDLQHGRLDPTRYGVVGPGYEVALAAVGLVARDLFRAAELISIVSAVATCMLWFFLLRRRTNPRLALFAALFITVNPYFFRYGYSVTTDALALALSAACLYLLFVRAGPRSAALAGLIGAAAFLTRYTAIVLLPVGVLTAAFGGRLVDARSSRRAEALAFAGAFVIPVGAWLAWSLGHGAGFGFQLHHNLAYEVFARARGIGWDAYQRDLQPSFPTLWSVIARDPLAVARQIVVNVGAHLLQDGRVLLGWPTAVCVALGVLAAATSGALRRAWPLAAAGVLTFVAFVPVFYSERYSIALLPFYAGAAAAFFTSHRWASVPVGRVVAVLLAAVPLGFSVARSVDLQKRVLRQQPVEALAAADALRALARPGDRVIARKPHVAYLSGVDPVGFPFADSLPQLADYAREHKARWLMFGFPETEARPSFRYLLDSTVSVPGLTARAVTRPRPAVLYEIGPEFGRRPAWFDNDTLVTLHDARAAALDRPRDVQTLLRAGTIELVAGDLVGARTHLERAADIAPSNVDVLLPLGEVMLKLGELRLAEMAYGRAEQLEPGNADARIGRGWVALFAGRDREAAQLWRPIIGLTPSVATLQRMRTLYAGLGDDDAVAEVEAALKKAGK